MAFEIAKLKDLLKDYPKEEVGIYVSYCHNMLTETDRNGKQKNIWFSHIETVKLAEYFRAVKRDKLDFDGKHITIISTGVSYDYIAYKNKMYLSYPESIIDVSLVNENDKFNFSKDSGKVNYNHVITNPFDNENIIGAYCVIKNKRGEFLTILSKSEIDKHRKVAKTDYIWKNWFREMALKTVIKKACKTHFSDIYQNIETIDNENYDLEKLPTEKIQKLSGVEFARLSESDNMDELGETLEAYENGKLTMYPNQVKELTGRYDMLMNREMNNGKDLF